MLFLPCLPYCLCSLFLRNSKKYLFLFLKHPLSFTYRSVIIAEDMQEAVDYIQDKLAFIGCPINFSISFSSFKRNSYVSPIKAVIKCQDISWAVDF